MCDECHHLFGHASSCPNNNPKIITKCENCGLNIYDSDEYIHTNDYGNFCDDSCFLIYCRKKGMISEIAPD